MNEFDSCLTMVRLGLSKLQEERAERRASLLSLETKALEAQEAERCQGQRIDHLGNLSVELFGEIARIVVEGDRTAVIGLSQVSKHWRRVIHNCSYLWGTLKLTRRRPKHKAKAWIERLKGILRELSVDSDVANDDGWPDDILSGIRWEGLQILTYHAWSVDIKQYLHQIGKSDALRSLETLDIIGHEDHPGKAQFPSSVTKLPNLQHLAFHHVSPSEDMMTRLLNCKNLLSFTLDDVLPEKAYNLHRLFIAQPLIERVVIRNSYMFSVKQAVTLKHLTHLDLKRVWLHMLLSDLSAPQILRLDAIREIDEFLDIVKNSRPNLTELTIRSIQLCPVSVSKIIAVLAVVSPTIQVLEVTNTKAAKIINYLAELQSLPDDTPEADFSSGPSLVCCPNLTYIDLSKCQDVKAGPLVRMVKARLPPNPSDGNSRPPQVKQITTLIINECDNVKSSRLPWLRQHVQSFSSLCVG